MPVSMVPSVAEVALDVEVCALGVVAIELVLVVEVRVLVEDVVVESKIVDAVFVLVDVVLNVGVAIEAEIVTIIDVVELDRTETVLENRMCDQSRTWPSGRCH